MKMYKKEFGEMGNLWPNQNNKGGRIMKTADKTVIAQLKLDREELLTNVSKFLAK